MPRDIKGEPETFAPVTSATAPAKARAPAAEARAIAATADSIAQGLGRGG